MLLFFIHNLSKSLSKKLLKTYNRDMSELSPKNAKFSLGQIVHHTKFKLSLIHI